MHEGRLGGDVSEVNQFDVLKWIHLACEHGNESLDRIGYKAVDLYSS
jgi:hypothetical protein